MAADSVMSSGQDIIWTLARSQYEPDTDPRVLCELAHDAIELALNSVIVAAGGRYRSTHDLVS